MAGPLAGQIAVITGSAEGIGRGVAIELAKAGADVCVNDIQPVNQGAAFAEELHMAYGVRALYVRADVSQRAEVEAMADEVESVLGPVSILVSNAVTRQRHTFLDTPFSELTKAVEVGIYGAFHVLQVFGARMVAQHIPGSIIQMTSPWAYLPYAGGTDYRVVKSAQHQMALSLATELMGQGIRVNLVEPGWVETDGEHRWHSPEKMQADGAELPFKRLCTVDEVGRTVVFACQEPYLTGAHLKIDGGLTLAYYGASGRAGTRPTDG
jgi:glucose 1-dehydrogenase